jgi:hypothetical protein
LAGSARMPGKILLVQYALASKDTLKRLILVHGEEKAANALMAKLAEHPELPKPAFPAKGAVFEI